MDTVHVQTTASAVGRSYCSYTPPSLITESPQWYNTRALLPHKPKMHGPGNTTENMGPHGSVEAAQSSGESGLVVPLVRNRHGGAFRNLWLRFT
jgi:hypothetical protein